MKVLHIKLRCNTREVLRGINKQRFIIYIIMKNSTVLIFQEHSLKWFFKSSIHLYITRYKLLITKKSLNG